MKMDLRCLFGSIMLKQLRCRFATLSKTKAKWYVQQQLVGTRLSRLNNNQAMMFAVYHLATWNNYPHCEQGEQNVQYFVFLNVT